MKKDHNTKEKFKQALISTIKVISGEFKKDPKNNKDINTKRFDFIEFDNLETKQNFIKLRAEADSEALKIKFSNKETYDQNAPKSIACKKLYDISEKMRYELLGSKMLKGISKNLKNNYNYLLSIKKKDQVKTKEDVTILEAFELYMLKNFFDITLNPNSENILGFWEKDFDMSLSKHINYLRKNIENQKIYNSTFSELLESMEILDSDKDDENRISVPHPSHYKKWFTLLDNIDLRRHLSEVELILIESSLKKTNGSVTDAAKLLKINRTTLIEKMKKYSIPKVGLD